MESVTNPFDPFHSPGARQVLVVDDDPYSLMSVTEVLESAGYYVVQASRVSEATERISTVAPDLIVLDVNLPDVDGYTFCRQLKADTRFSHIPVLFMTSRDEVEDCVEGFAAGGEDYVTKPFRRDELIARVKTHIRLHDALQAMDRLRALAFDANPLTHLPGNTSIEASIQEAIDKGEEKMVLYADLDNFKAFNDRYGFDRGDRLLRYTADSLLQCITTAGSGFVGNVGGDDFVAIVDLSQADEIGAAILATFDKGISSFYDSEDVVKGGIFTVNRKGESEFFPLAAISLAGVPLKKDRFFRTAEVSRVCAKIKKLAKKITGSSYVVDQREN